MARRWSWGSGRPDVPPIARLGAVLGAGAGAFRPAAGSRPHAPRDDAIHLRSMLTRWLLALGMCALLLPVAPAQAGLTRLPAADAPARRAWAWGDNSADQLGIGSSSSGV